MAHLCCSIEIEPKTLNEGQLNHAREVAVDMVQKMETNEISNIFIEGMKPVVSTKEMEEIVEKRDQLHKLVGYKESVQVCDRLGYCKCISSSIDDSPDRVNLGEPLSAPF